MERKFHAALTERQREIAFMALSLLDISRDRDFTAGEIQETLKLLHRIDKPEPRVEHIPVILNADARNTIVGLGQIAGDTLFIEVNHETLVDKVAHLAKAGDISELYLGLGFPVTPMYTQRTRSADAVIASARQQEASKIDAQMASTRVSIVQMNARGYSNAEIAEHTGLAESSVRTILESE